VGKEKEKETDKEEGVEKCLDEDTDVIYYRARRGRGPTKCILVLSTVILTT
jgi:hypothetical protein